MTNDQLILFALLIFVFVFLIWGRWRYDLVAFTALVLAVVTGVVPTEQAFAGFGHPATVIVALVLIVSRALSNSGVIELVGRYVISASRSLVAHVGIMAGVAAALSAVMNNVAALALLMPLDLQAAAKAGRSPALTLMPLSFASILGGMITLIGTPPNIIVAEFRGTALGAPFSMFDFTPVGAICAGVGVAFVALVGWRLIPAARAEHDSGQELFTLSDYVAEVLVPEGSATIGKRIGDLEGTAAESDAAVVGVERGGRRMFGGLGNFELRSGDVLVVEAGPEGIEKLVGAMQLEYVRPKGGTDKRTKRREDLSLVEVVVPVGARIQNRSAAQLHLLTLHDVTLLGVSRQGQRLRQRVRDLTIRAGDVLLLLGSAERLADVVTWLGCLPLAERGLRVLQRNKALLSIAALAAAVALATVGWLPLDVGLAAVVIVLTASGVVPLRELYDSVEWPVIILLGSMIPIGAALESTGGTSLIANGILSVTGGSSPLLVLALLMAVTMSLSDIMNNTATAVIAAPIAIEVAARLGVSPDPFLMAVAVAASCAFLTPIGHKNNTLIMGPGGYRFADYWRMGLPLEILVIAVGVPAVVWVWPF
jgi:di/tricarboxylate transporter